MVNRCICYDVPFERLLSLIKEQGKTIDQACEQTGAGQGCGRCREYIQMIEKTGRSTFEVNEFKKKESD